MRVDEQGTPCPATLGEYRDLCASLGGEGCQAVNFLDDKIAESPNGRDEEVLAPDSQMRALLMPMLRDDKRKQAIAVARTQMQTVPALCEPIDQLAWAARTASRLSIGDGIDPLTAGEFVETFAYAVYEELMTRAGGVIVEYEKAEEPE